MEAGRGRGWRVERGGCGKAEKEEVVTSLYVRSDSLAISLLVCTLCSAIRFASLLPSPILRQLEATTAAPPGEKRAWITPQPLSAGWDAQLYCILSR